MKRMQTRMKGRMIRKVGKWEQWQDEKLECKQIVQTNLETRRLLRLPRECSTLEIFLTSSHCPYAYSHSRYQLHIEVQCTPTIISSQFQNSFAFVFCSTRNEKSVFLCGSLPLTLPTREPSIVSKGYLPETKKSYARSYIIVRKCAVLNLKTPRP